MLIAELLSGLKYNTYGVDLRGYVTRAASDSRLVTFGSIFICLRGTKRDGHDFAEEAMRRGAVAVVSEEFIPRIPCIVVKNTRLADAVIWNNLCGRPAEHMRMIGITGTNGKTSTAVFLSSIMNAAGIRTASMGTLGCVFDGEKIPCEGAEISDVPSAMTTPDPQFLYGTLSRLYKMGAEAVVMEVSSHSIAQLKVKPIHFEVGVFTNLSPEHLDFHNSMEEYYKVKASMFASCQKAVVGCDSGYGARLASELGERTRRVISREARGLVCDADGVGYTFGELRIRSAVPGLFTVQNTMLASVAARELGIDDKTIALGIASAQSIPGRMEKACSDTKNNIDVFIDYAHTPEAMEKAIKTVREFAPNRRLTVLFGCGGDRDKTKRPVMGGLAERTCDRVIITSDNPRTEDRNSIILDILAGVREHDNIRVILNRAEAIRYAVLTARRDEIILLCGKGHEDYETDSEGKHPFCEKDIAREAVRRR